MVTKMRVFVPLLTLAMAAVIFLFSGCTLGGLALGSHLDRINTDTTRVSLESLTYYIHPDTCEVEKNDRVLIVLNSGQSLEGKVKEIDRGNTINLVVEGRQGTHYYSRRVDVQWADIQSISVIDKPIESRLLVTAFGVVIDIGVAVAIWMYGDSQAYGGGMGNWGD
jgi:hypothetical protein